MGLTNADNAFTLYYVKFRAASPKVRVSLTFCRLLFMQIIIFYSKNQIFFFPPLQSLIEQIEQRAEKIPEWVFL